MAKRSIPDYAAFGNGVAEEKHGTERNAMAYYRSEIRRSGFSHAHFNLARLLAKRRRFREAALHYRQARRAASSASDASSALNNLGDVLWKLGQHAGAMAAFREAMRKNPRDIAPRVNIALEFGRTGHRAEAIRAWAKLSRFRKGDPELEKWTGYAFIQHDLDVSRGVRHLHSWLKSHPRDAVAMADLAVGLMKRGDLRRAAALARRAHRLAPADPDVAEQVGQVVRTSARRPARATQESGIAIQHRGFNSVRN